MTQAQKLKEQESEEKRKKEEALKKLSLEEQKETKQEELDIKNANDAEEKEKLRLEVDKEETEKRSRREEARLATEETKLKKKTLKNTQEAKDLDKTVQDKLRDITLEEEAQKALETDKESRGKENLLRQKRADEKEKEKILNQKIKDKQEAQPRLSLGGIKLIDGYWYSAKDGYKQKFYTALECARHFNPKEKE